MKKLDLDSLDKAYHEFIKNYLIDLLKNTDWSVTKAAKLAKRNRTAFYKLLNQHEIVPSDFRIRKQVAHRSVQYGGEQKEALLQQLWR